MKQRQAREIKANCSLGSEAKIRETGNEHGFIPSTEERDKDGVCAYACSYCPL